MAVALGRAIIVALVFWSWVPVLTLSLAFVQPVELQMGGDVIYTIDRRGSDDTRVTLARKSDLRSGDRFAASALPLEGRLLLYGYAATSPSDHLSLDVLRDGKRRAVTLHPGRYNIFNGLQPVAIALLTLSVFLNALTMTAAGALVHLELLTMAKPARTGAKAPALGSSLLHIQSDATIPGCV